MSKDGVKIPGRSNKATGAPRESVKTSKPTLAKRLLEANKKKISDDKKPKIQPQQRVHRARGAHGAHGAAGAHGAEAHDDAAGAGGEQGGVGGIGEGADELHRRRHADADLVWEEQHVEEHHDANDAAESAAVGVDAIKRSKGDTGGGDGFDQGKDQREAYERYLKGNVAADKERFDDLRSRGTKDDFRVDLAPKEVEALGIQRAAAHVVRLYDAWTLEGTGRGDAIVKAATFLADFVSAINIKKVLAEMESKPIRDVYPLEVLLKMLDERPELLPGVRSGEIVGNADDLANSKKVFAGHAVPVPVPKDTHIKSFALLGGGRPGYEFYPTPAAEDRYTLLIDTPGSWTFAVLAAPLQQLGRIQRETQEALLQLFTVNVWAMGKKGEPISAEDWAESAEAAYDAIVHDEPEEESISKLTMAPPLPVQIRIALEKIARDAPAADATSIATAATTYSWELVLFKPGSDMKGEPILRVVVDKAGPFDPVWMKARETIAAKQKEYEPSRQPITPDDLNAALRRARVR